MPKNNYHVIIRHGPTHSDESINFDKYLKIITSQIMYIKNFLTTKEYDLKKQTIIIHTSPFERCITTAKFISTYFNVISGNDNVKIDIDKNLRRVDTKKGENMDQCKKRAKSYGNTVYTDYLNSKNIHIFITHSSFISSFVSGLTNSIMKTEKLAHSSLSIMNADTRDIVVYNKSFN
jgi:hypothetical protein